MGNKLELEFKLALDGAPAREDVKAVKLDELSDAEVSIWEAGQIAQARKYEQKFPGRRNRTSL